MKMAGILAASGLMLFAAGGAQALPGASVAGATATNAPITLARAGCGFGEHRGPMGGCRLNRGPRGRMRRAITGAPRGCPPRMHRFRGVCRY